MEHTISLRGGEEATSQELQVLKGGPTKLSFERRSCQRPGKGGALGGVGITSARGTVIAAEVAVKNMYHEEPELLPAASGTNTEKGAPPKVGGDEEPVWLWEQPVWPAEVEAAAPLAMGGAISADSGDQTGQDSVFVCFDICFFMLHS